MFMARKKRFKNQSFNFNALYKPIAEIIANRINVK
jgi:hypothetical protein